LTAETLKSDGYVLEAWMFLKELPQKLCPADLIHDFQEVLPCQDMGRSLQSYLCGDYLSVTWPVICHLLSHPHLCLA
jgi:hypothetical protein